jgi:hypothetical protein
MLWSNGGGKPPELKRAAFADVTPGSRRPPAWVGGQKNEEKEPAPQHAPAPGREAVPAREGRKEAERNPSPNVVPRAPRLPAEAAHERGSLRPIQVSSQPRTSLLAMEMVSPLESLRVPAPASAPVAAEPSPEMVAAFAAALESLADARRSILVDSTSDLAKLAGMIAKRVIGREVSLDPRIVLALVQEGLEALGTYDRIRVRLGPDFESMQTELSQKLKGRGVEYEVFIDIELPPYGCVVETDLGRVDESIERRLEQLFRSLVTESDTPPTA